VAAAVSAPAPGL